MSDEKRFNLNEVMPEKKKNNPLPPQPTKEVKKDEEKKDKKE